jgi:hypothetical protein
VLLLWLLSGKEQQHKRGSDGEDRTFENYHCQHIAKLDEPILRPSVEARTPDAGAVQPHRACGIAATRPICQRFP